MRLHYQALLLVAIVAVGLAAWDLVGPAGSGAPSAQPRGAVPASPVVVEPAYAGSVVQGMQAIGTVRANEAVMITPRVTGLVRELLFDSGAQVEAGDLIARLDGAELEAQLRSAEATAQNAERLLEQARALARTNNVARSRVEELEAALTAANAAVEAAQARLDELDIVAPFAGTLGIRRISPGSLVSPGTAIFTLDDLSVVRLDFKLPETLLAGLRPGMHVALSSDAYPDRDFTGTITNIDSRVDPVTRTVDAVAEVANEDGALRPGMFMTAEVVIGRNDAAIMVPEAALVPLGARQFVYVVTGDVAERREIGIGTRLVGAVEVLSGLDLGELVVVRGVQRLRDGAPVEIVPPAGTDPAAGGAQAGGSPRPAQG